MKLTDNFFKKVEKKTNVNKDTILSLAEKLQDENMKNESVLREVIQQISSLTGKTVSKEKEDKIVKAIVNDQVPDNIEDYMDK
ncbi:MAG: stage VI sporulation protein F [Bacilli bacterium]|nr:stage VI sporulation protein F [Bacilli bacterium]